MAHNAVLIHDPSEQWPKIRAGTVTGNDGGQSHNWPHHNGAVADPAAWEKDRKLYEIGKITAFADHDRFLYVAGDCSSAYSPKKLDHWTRQIVYLRPGTFVICDRVATTRPELRKTWLLQTMQPPERRGSQWVITNGKGRLFVQTLLPSQSKVELKCGEDLYCYDGQSFPPERETGPAPVCRMEVSPASPSQVDLFLHVLTAVDAEVDSVPAATCDDESDCVRVRTADAEITFFKQRVSGVIELGGTRHTLGE